MCVCLLFLVYDYLCTTGRTEMVAAFVVGHGLTVGKTTGLRTQGRRGTGVSTTTVSVLAQENSSASGNAGGDAKAPNVVVPKVVVPKVVLSQGISLNESVTSSDFRFGSRKLRVFGGSTMKGLTDEVASYLGKERGGDPIVQKQ